MDASKLNKKMFLYGQVGTKESLGTTKPVYGLIKPIFCQIIPANLSGSVQSTVAGTDYASVTHTLRCRKKSIPDPKTNMYFLGTDNLRYDVQYWQPDFKNNDFWEFMLRVKTE